MTPTYCPECKTQIDPSAKNCPHCGYPLLSAPAAAQPPPAAATSPEPPAESGRQRGEKPTVQKTVSFLVICAGLCLIALGLYLRVPSDSLTTYSFYDSAKYTTIREYVGGDAYNYIIGASLVAGQIAGIIAAKSVLVSVGVLIVCLGFITRFSSKG